MTGATKQRLAGVLLMLSLLAAPAVASEINACKYLVVTDFTSDPYGIAKELRAQARARGFAVISGPADISPSDSFKACVMLGSWSAGGTGGRIAVRVVDTASGALIAE